MLRCFLFPAFSCLVILACIVVVGGCKRGGEPQSTPATQPVAAPVPDGGQATKRVEVDLETVQSRGGKAAITMGVVPSVLPRDVGLVTLFVIDRAKRTDPEKLFAETQLQVQVTFPDRSIAAATTIMRDGQYQGQLTVWYGAADIVKDGEIQLQLESSPLLRYEGAGRLYVWVVDSANRPVSDRRDVKLDFGGSR
jgi:hypothetical protein